jgi:hypothetical protein
VSRVGPGEDGFWGECEVAVVSELERPTGVAEDEGEVRGELNGGFVDGWEFDDVEHCCLQQSV